jgi:RpiR family carbohydrate utilization transcriptional regulator
MSGATPTLWEPDNILHHVARISPDLRRSERKVADIVLRESARVVRMTLAALARESEVSQPTAIRFCRTAGCDGFPDLKIRVAHALASGAPYVHRDIEPSDSLPTLTDKVFASSIEALQLLRGQLDMQSVSNAVDAIASVPTVFHADSHLQRMSAATLGPGDVAIAFSYTGELRDVVRTVQMAQAQGAFVIAVTRTMSAMARASSLTIGVDTMENTFVYAPMTTRLAHLAVVDTLATAVAMRSGRDGVARIRRVKQAMRDEWLIDPEHETSVNGVSEEDQE